MYANRNHVRTFEKKLRFNSEENDLIEAMARYSRKQTATYLYEKVMEQIKHEAQLTELGR